MEPNEVEFLAEKELISIVPNFSQDKIYLIGVCICRLKLVACHCYLYCALVLYVFYFVANKHFSCRMCLPRVKCGYSGLLNADPHFTARRIRTSHR